MQWEEERWIVQPTRPLTTIVGVYSGFAAACFAPSVNDSDCAARARGGWIFTTITR
jgi:hypothetical protein